MNEKKVKKFEQLLLSTGYEGMDNLIKWIREESDFYTAPASTRFHSCHEGGLLEHSLNVYYCLMAKRESPLWKKKLADYEDSELIVASLLHDLCKANFYGIEMRNKKNEAGVWEKVPFYTVQEQFPYGHGEKSVYILNRFVRVSDDINLAIRFHMGFSEPKEIWNSLGKAMDMCPLVLALHEADMESTHLLEEEN